MLRHVALLEMKDGTPDSAVAGILTELESLKRTLPAEVKLVNYTFGQDAGLVPSGNAHVAVVADFEDEDGYRAYQSNAEHQAIIKNFIIPHLRKLTTSQFIIKA
ncbi:hypothetical protein CBR_g57906 [Chara braunii]|uniref:Stress-response A/B barrel domain-containing protein n=1 Tax=Chara braunii TaxID=69332 RepID=A0A388MEG9_CHABU|nr:hypothetical protein CBR_g57906 [Chara braunii]|eukprot:GBG92950.1 hypothetical protein CBR_g57906 [Chara braunii]